MNSLPGGATAPHMQKDLAERLLYTTHMYFIQGISMISEEKFRKLFMDYGLEPTRLKVGGTMTSDFEVKKDSTIKFYCEVKNIDEDSCVSSLKNDPTFNSISAHIHKATKQLRNLNPERKFFNVIGFYNQNSSCNVNDLIDMITGNFHADNGISYPIYKNISEGRIKPDLQHIDLMIWLDECAKPRYIFGDNTSELSILFDINDKDIKKIY